MSTTRRTLLAGLASLPMAPCSAAPARDTVGADQVAMLIERHQAALGDCNPLRRGMSDDDLDELLDAEAAALEALLAARPTTWRSFAQIAAYLDQHVTTSGEWSIAGDCLAALAEASRQLTDGGIA